MTEALSIAPFAPFNDGMTLAVVDDYVVVTITDFKQGSEGEDTVSAAFYVTLDQVPKMRDWLAALTKSD
jgi:hypothetical protein